MPVKSSTPRVKKALLPSPIITMTEPAVDVSLESKVVPAMAILASVAMLMAFGSIIAAAAVNMSSMNKPPIPFLASQCTDGDKANLQLDSSQIYPLDGFVSTFGKTSMVKNFDPFTASKAICRDSVKYVGYIDQCYKDNYGPLGYISSVAVSSCAPTDKRCRVREGFAYPMLASLGNPVVSTTKYAIASWNFLCKNGCMAGACIKDPAPICTDSDMNSTTGQSDPFIAGSVNGLMYGLATTTYDICLSTSTLNEYSCLGNGVIGQSNIGCANGCVNNACVRESTPLFPGDVVKVNGMTEYYYYGKDKKLHLIPNAGTAVTWGIAVQNAITVSKDDFFRSAIGENVTVRPVGYIISFSDKLDTYYFVMPSKQLKQFENIDAIVKLFGSSWSNRVIIVPSSYRTSYYNNGNPVSGLITSSSKYPSGSLVHFTGSIGTMYIQSDKLRMFDNSDIFIKNQLKSSLIAETNSSASIAYPEGEIIKTIEDRFIMPY